MFSSTVAPNPNWDLECFSYPNNKTYWNYKSVNIVLATEKIESLTWFTNKNTIIVVERPQKKKQTNEQTKAK